MSMERILETLRPYIYKGNNGRDIIKRYFNVSSKEIPIAKPEYILGFNNGWKLPQLEGENGYSIIVYANYQKDVYNKAKKLLINSVKTALKVVFYYKIIIKKKRLEKYG